MAPRDRSAAGAIDAMWSGDSNDGSDSLWLGQAAKLQIYFTEKLCVDNKLSHILIYIWMTYLSSAKMCPKLCLYKLQKSLPWDTLGAGRGGLKSLT